MLEQRSLDYAVHGQTDVTQNGRNGGGRCRARRLRDEVSRSAAGASVIERRPPCARSRSGELLVGSCHPYNGRSAALSCLGLSRRAGKAERQDRRPQLRTWRRRYVARLGHRLPRCGDRSRPRIATCGCHRVRRHRVVRGAAAATARIRCHHLRESDPAAYDVQYVARTLVAGVPRRRDERAHAAVGRAVPIRRGDRVP